MPRLGLDEIEESSPTLAAALRAVLKGRPLRAKRILGCCGMNTYQLVDVLVDTITQMKIKLMDEMGLVAGDRFSRTVSGSKNAHDFVEPVFKLLQRISRVSRVKLGELLLSNSTRELVNSHKSKADRREIEKASCQDALRLLLETEVLCGQVEPMLEKGDRINHNFSVQINGGIGSFDELLVCLKEFRKRDQAAVGWLKNFEGLQAKLTAAKKKLGLPDSGADAGRECALGLLNRVMEGVKKYQDSLDVSASVRDLQGQRDAIVGLIEADSRYCGDFSSHFVSGATIGVGVLELMLQHVKGLYDILTEHGVAVWSQCAQYMRAINPEASVNIESISEQVKKLTDQLLEQQQLLNELIRNNPHGIIIKSALSFNGSKTLANTITRGTDFLRRNLEAPIAESPAKLAVVPPEEAATVSVTSSATVEESVPVAETAAGEVSPGDVEVAVVGDKLAGHSEKPQPSKSPAASDALAPRSNTAAFFPAYVREFIAPPSNLSEAQKDGIDKVVKFIARILIEGIAFPRSKLESIVNFLTDSIDRGVTSADDLAPGIVTKLHTSQNVFTVQWLVDRGVTARLETLLLMQHSSAPSP